jgi:hypothetical protein
MGGRSTLVTPTRRQKTESWLQTSVTGMLLGVLQSKQIWDTLPYRCATYAILPDGCLVIRPISIQLQAANAIIGCQSMYPMSMEQSHQTEDTFIMAGNCCREDDSWCWIFVVLPTHTENCSHCSNNNWPISVYHAVKRSSGLTHTMQSGINDKCCHQCIVR